MCVSHVCVSILKKMVRGPGPQSPKGLYSVSTTKVRSEREWRMERFPGLHHQTLTTFLHCFHTGKNQCMEFGEEISELVLIQGRASGLGSWTPRDQSPGSAHVCHVATVHITLGKACDMRQIPQLFSSQILLPPPHLIRKYCLLSGGDYQQPYLHPGNCLTPRIQHSTGNTIRAFGD